MREVVSDSYPLPILGVRLSAGSTCATMLLVLALTSCTSTPRPPPESNQSAVAGAQEEETLVFRDAFTLQLRVDNENLYEQHFPANASPYVADGTIYLFPGERFAVDVVAEGDEVFRVSYQKDPDKGDIALDFKRVDVQMMLRTENRLQKAVRFDALMVLPTATEPRTTKLLPIRPGLESFELWPHPILQLVLTNLTLGEH